MRPVCALCKRDKKTAQCPDCKQFFCRDCSSRPCKSNGHKMITVYPNRYADELGEISQAALDKLSSKRK